MFSLLINSLQYIMLVNSDYTVYSGFKPDCWYCVFPTWLYTLMCISVFFRLTKPEKETVCLLWLLENQRVSTLVSIKLNVGNVLERFV